MAAEAAAYGIAAVSQAPEPFRRMLSDMFGRRPGICTSASWAVTQSGSPAMNCVVAAGTGLVLGSESALQGLYFCQSTSTTTVTITAADATNPRRDLIVARIRDNQYATGPTSAFSLEAVAGTPAASPADPTVPANCLVIARIQVNASPDATIVTGDITDLRTSYTGQTRAAGLGGTVVCTSTTRPTINLHSGLVAFETDTKKLIVYTGSVWEQVPTASSAEVLTQEFTTSTSYVDLTTSGPAVTLLTGSKVVALISAQVDPNTSTSVAVSGATTTAASDAAALYVPAGIAGGLGTMLTFTVTPGVNTFTMKYKSNAGANLGFLRRRIAVMPSI